MRNSLVLSVLLLLAGLVLVGAPFVGMEKIPLRALWESAGATSTSDRPARGDSSSKAQGNGEEQEELDALDLRVAHTILWDLRLPRVLMAFLAGAGLAASGLAFQAVFRNPLAEPFTLGVASGAALGASIYIHLGLPFSLLWISGSSWFAFAGALLAIALVYGLTRLRQGFSTATMLLAGVAVSFSFSSLILFIQYLSDFTQSFVLLRWVMGGLHNVVGLREVLTVLPLVAAGVVIVLYLTHELNLVTTGEELAASRGVAVDLTKTVLFVAVSLMVGGIVSACGPIGFVGLIVPHICRLLVGPDHRWLTPATLLCGAILLTACDALARTLMAPTELPVGILTALLGGPFFLWLLLGRAPQVETV